MYHTILCVLASTWPLHGAWCTNYCKLNSNFFWKHKIYLSMVSPSWSVSSWAIPVFVISLNSWISFSSFVYLSWSSYQHSVLSVYFLSLIPWSSYISQPFLTGSYSMCLSSTHNLWWATVSEHSFPTMIRNEWYKYPRAGNGQGKT